MALLPRRYFAELILDNGKALSRFVTRIFNLNEN